ncbi:MAG: recombination mediator RecR [Clostridia bacterium]|nr:recombination mediator RecR [Clostridia bacterium]MDD4686374.1 recombination mediator RecR [Clostridia bacterium]
MNQPLERLIEMFRSLPGVGLKSAQRYAYFIIKSSDEDAKEFAESIIMAKKQIKHCQECGGYTDKTVCPICLSRNSKLICVIAEPKDVSVMEKVRSFKGVYHVLNGTISPLENRGPNDIRLKELLQRINKHNTEEVIVATNPDVEGDATAMYIAKILKPLGVRVTRIAQGISMGTELEYADEITLSKAIESRIEI